MESAGPAGGRGGAGMGRSGSPPPAPPETPATSLRLFPESSDCCDRPSQEVRASRSAQLGYFAFSDSTQGNLHFPLLPGFCFSLNLWENRDVPLRTGVMLHTHFHFRFFSEFLSSHLVKTEIKDLKRRVLFFSASWEMRLLGFLLMSALQS